MIFVIWQRWIFEKLCFFGFRNTAGLVENINIDLKRIFHRSTQFLILNTISRTDGNIVPSLSSWIYVRNSRYSSTQGTVRYSISTWLHIVLSLLRFVKNYRSYFMRFRHKYFEFRHCDDFTFVIIAVVTDLNDNNQYSSNTLQPNISKN